MKTAPKTVVAIVAAALAVLFACLFFHQRGLLQQQPKSGSALLMTVCLVFFILFLIVFCWLGAVELKKFLGGRAEEWMLQAGQPTAPAAEIEEAQKIRASGDPLEAIRLMREYLQANPYEVHVMSRIAEIYRYDLKNDLAAALEYEELLKKKIPDDQWAWAALHLAKLYGRLNELEKSVTLLEKLDTKYDHTIAGRRAKKALEQMRNPEGQSGSDEDSESDDAAN